MFWIYILRSESTGKTYVGQTSDLTRRIAEHNNPQHSDVKYTTKNKGPWILIHSEQFETRAHSMQREKWLKTGVGRQWIKAQIL
jgi:putative endonuclease